jgi:hypothetical protein
MSRYARWGASVKEDAPLLSDPAGASRVIGPELLVCAVENSSPSGGSR